MIYMTLYYYTVYNIYNEVCNKYCSLDSRLRGPVELTANFLISSSALHNYWFCSLSIAFDVSVDYTSKVRTLIL